MVVLCICAPGVLEDVAGALCQQVLRRSRADSAGIRALSMHDRAHHAAAVERGHGRQKFDLVVANGCGQGANRRLASAAQRLDDRTLGIERERRNGVRDGADSLCDTFVSGADFNRDDALAGRGNARADRQRERDPVREAESPQPGCGQNERPVLACVELSQTRIQVAANRGEVRVREQSGELRDAAYAGCANVRRFSEDYRQFLEAVRRARRGSCGARSRSRGEV